MAEAESSSTGSEGTSAQDKKLDGLSEEVVHLTKKPKLDLSNDPETKLETRLGGILCCAVCLDLPRSTVYQCANGHLMCAGCFTRVLADARIRDETATCPNCRVEISRTLATRNLAVEKAVSELPADCQFCNQKYSRNILERHETELCDERPVRCPYHVLGCGWRGPFHEGSSHELQCQQPSHTGAQILPYLRRQAVLNEEDKLEFSKVIGFLSLEKIGFNDLQLKPNRTDEFIRKLYYETRSFTALSHQWAIVARLNDNQRDPHLTNERYMSYQLILKSKINNPLNVKFMILRGPFGDVRVDPKLYQFEFTDSCSESPFFSLPLIGNAECNKFLAARTIDFRLMIGLMTKGS